jgi:hypothetical protein
VATKVEGGLAGDGFDAARAGGDGHLGDDFDEADFAGGGNVRAAAEFAAVAADVHDADELAVFVAEEGEGALGLLVEFGLVGVDLGVVDDLGVDELLDLEELGVRDGFEVREVEAHAVGGLGCSGLADVRAEDFAERPVNQVRGTVVAVDRATRREVDGELGGGAGGERGRALGHFVEVAAGFILHAIGDVDELPLISAVPMSPVWPPISA